MVVFFVSFFFCEVQEWSDSSEGLMGEDGDEDEGDEEGDGGLDAPGGSRGGDAWFLFGMVSGCW